VLLPSIAGVATNAGLLYFIQYSTLNSIAHTLVFKLVSSIALYESNSG